MNESIGEEGGKQSYWFYYKVTRVWMPYLVASGVSSAFFNLVVVIAAGETKKSWMESAQFVSPVVGWFGLAIGVFWVVKSLPPIIGKAIATYQKRKRK